MPITVARAVAIILLGDAVHHMSEQRVALGRPLERADARHVPRNPNRVIKTGRPEIANDPMGVEQSDVLARWASPPAWACRSETAIGAQRRARPGEKTPKNPRVRLLGPARIGAQSGRGKQGDGTERCPSVVLNRSFECVSTVR